MESTPTDFSLDLVPNEIWTKILMLVPTDTLLHHCRFVSSKFQLISTQICHSFRKIALKHDEKAEYGFDFCLKPWSSYSYKHISYYSAEMRVLFPKYGFMLRELTAKKVELEEFTIGALNFTPNLRSLTLIGRFKWNEAPIRVKYVPLLHLTSLCIAGSSIKNEVQQNWFLQLFGKSPLKEITISIGPSLQDTTALAHVLKRIPSIFLSLELYSNENSSEYIQPFIAANLKMKTIGFYLRSLSKPSNDDYTLLSKLLKNTADVIEELTMGGDLALDTEPFMFPILQNLKKLSLDFPGVESKNLKTFFSELSELNVPALEIVTISDFCFPSPGGSTKLLQPNLVFETVVELTISSSHRFVDNWSRVFPYLRKLKTKILWEPIEVGFTYSFKHLEQLNLEICVPDDISENASSLLSGIPNLESIDGKSDEEINEMRQTHSLPCILQLTKLKSLSLEFLRIAVALNDTVAYTLGKFEPLKKLTLVNCTMPEDLRVAMAAKHACFEILDEKKY